MYQYGCDSWAFGGTGVPWVSLINVTKFFQEDGDYQHKKLPVINVQKKRIASIPFKNFLVYISLE